MNSSASFFRQLATSSQFVFRLNYFSASLLPFFPTKQQSSAMRVQKKKIYLPEKFHVFFYKSGKQSIIAVVRDYRNFNPNC
jgi:hypothetical protein